MGKTTIEWTDYTWNPVTGCMVHSPGCTNCYAMKLAGTRLKNLPSRRGLTRMSSAGPVWNGEVRFNREWLDQPMLWRSPRNIFVVAHGDLFYEKVEDLWIAAILHAMKAATQHQYQVLTKRPDRAARILASVPAQPNWLIGTSVEDQKRADERLAHLRAIARQGWRTFVSYEPAIGPVDWSGWEFIKWMISGGESGPDARPSHPDWHRATRDWCAAHGVPYFFKQYGAWAPLRDGHGGFLPDDARTCVRLRPNGTTGAGGCPMQLVGKKRAGRLLDGVEHNELPGPS